ncbi:M16 family metallopeptidase [Flavobacterium sp. '19STA2R22 D10 B1']|uniref:M16 family metallopeptidase n=1 Tax=Flavobacterium aerium TaxID=3037261 RepID=UPI00278C88AE|nr:pitrilysin family protein [Flavobacterium sp. '19STA2R22 D10 B1']
MKKIIYLLTGLFLTFSMEAQTDRSQPKPGPAPTVNVKKPQTFELPNGLKVMVVENHKLPRVSINLTIDNDPFAEGSKKGVDDLTSMMMGNGTSKITKDAYNEEIDFLGASVNFSSSGAYSSSLSKYYSRIFELTAAGALDPLFTQEEFDKEKAKLLENIKSQEKSVSANAQRVVNILAFGKNHPGGEYTSEATINNVTLADVKQHYNLYFVPQNAYLVIIGDVNFDETKKLVEQYFSLWKNAKAPKIAYSDPKNVQYTQVNFIDMPNAVQSEVSVVNTVNLKMGDKDYFAAILANQILGGGGEGRLFLNLREKHGWTYGAYSSISGNKFVTKFTSTASVRNAVTDSSVVEFLNELKRIRTTKVSAEELKNAKAKYVGNFVMQMEKPQTIARYALNIETQNLPKDYYENYIKNINAVTADDIMKAAKKYFSYDNARIVVVGKATDVLPGLEKLKTPILYFDRFGNPTSKPEAKTVSTNVTAKSVLENYIKVIGGDKAVKSVNTIATKGLATIPGAPAPLNYSSKLDAKGLSVTELTMQNISIMKQVVNDNSGYVLQQGQKVVLEGEDLAKTKSVAFPVPELGQLGKADLKLTGIESINGKDAYGVQTDGITSFYDVKSGLKLAQSTMEEGKTVTISFDDYRDVKGVKVPYKMVMNVGMDIEINISEVLINEGVSTADFQ